MCIELAPTSMAAIRMDMPAAERRALPALGQVRHCSVIFDRPAHSTMTPSYFLTPILVLFAIAGGVVLDDYTTSRWAAERAPRVLKTAGAFAAAGAATLYAISPYLWSDPREFVESRVAPRAARRPADKA